MSINVLIDKSMLRPFARLLYCPGFINVDHNVSFATYGPNVYDDCTDEKRCWRTPTLIVNGQNDFPVTSDSGTHYHDSRPGYCRSGHQTRDLVKWDKERGRSVISAVDSPRTFRSPEGLPSLDSYYTLIGLVPGKVLLSYHAL